MDTHIYTHGYTQTRNTHRDRLMDGHIDTHTQIHTHIHTGGHKWRFRDRQAGRYTLTLAVSGDWWPSFIRSNDTALSTPRTSPA